MQIIYAAPFILLSLIACSFCLFIPRLRRYALEALVVPVAFGFCVIVGMLLIVLAAQNFSREIRSFMEVRGLLSFIVIYFTPGIAGAWVALMSIKMAKTAIPGNSKNPRGEKSTAVANCLRFRIFCLKVRRHS